MRLYVTHTHTTEMKVSGSQSNNSSNLVWLVDEDKVDALSRGEDVEAKAWLSETVGEIVAIQHISRNGLHGVNVLARDGAHLHGGTHRLRPVQVLRCGAKLQAVEVMGEDRGDLGARRRRCRGHGLCSVAVV